MNAELLFEALNEAAPEDILRAGRAGGYLEARNMRPIVRIALVAAAVLILLAGAVAAKTVLGIWNDRWVQTPAADPEAVVRSAIENQSQKEYTISVRVESIAEDVQETEKVRAGAGDSMLARQNGRTDTSGALKGSADFKAFYAEYTVAYDHTKTFYPDGRLGQWFYLIRDGDGGWEIWDSCDPIALDPPAEPVHPTPTDTDGAVQAVTEMVLAWESFDDVRAITVDRAECSEAHRQRALALLPGSSLALAEGWTEEYLQMNLAAVEITYTTEYNPYPDLPDPPPTTETDVYYLLRDPATGQWQNSEITGFMDSQE